MSIGQFICWIGLFIFGMLQFERAIKELGWKTIKRLLQHYTNKVWKWVCMWISMTAFAQSSTVVSLIVVWFVWAWVLSLHNAVSVIVGANLGSTITPWMITLLWFKADIFSLSFYFVWLGWFWLLFTNEYSKAYNFWKLLFWFWLLFLWLNFLKEAVMTFTSQIDISAFANVGLGFAVLIWLGLSLLVQTSVATSAILLSALYANLITFDLAVWVMIGANIGSSLSTAIMWSLSSTWKSRAKKQLMIGHLLFNLVCTVLVVFLLPWVKDLVRLIVRNGDPMISLNVFHTLFNLIWVILLTPLIGLFTKRISRVYPANKSWVKLHIEEVATNMPEEVLSALENDLELLRQKVYRFIESCFGLREIRVENELEKQFIPSPWRKRFLRSITETVKKKFTHDDPGISVYHPDSLPERINEYTEIKEIEATLYAYILRMPKEEFINGSIEKLNKVQERIYKLLDAAKTIKDDMNHIEDISYMEDSHITAYWMQLCKQIQSVIAQTLSQNGSISNIESDDRALYNFLQEHVLLENRSQDWISNQDIAEILKTSRHALYVINLLNQEKEQKVIS